MTQSTAEGMGSIPGQGTKIPKHLTEQHSPPKKVGGVIPSESMRQDLSHPYPLASGGLLASLAFLGLIHHPDLCPHLQMVLSVCVCVCVCVCVQISPFYKSTGQVELGPS